MEARARVPLAEDNRFVFERAVAFVSRLLSRPTPDLGAMPVDHLLAVGWMLAGEAVERANVDARFRRTMGPVVLDVAVSHPDLFAELDGLVRLRTDRRVAVARTVLPGSLLRVFANDRDAVCRVLAHADDPMTLAKRLSHVIRHLPSIPWRTVRARPYWSRRAHHYRRCARREHVSRLARTVQPDRRPACSASRPRRGHHRSATIHGPPDEIDGDPDVPLIGERSHAPRADALGQLCFAVPSSSRAPFQRSLPGSPTLRLPHDGPPRSRHSKRGTLTTCSSDGVDVVLGLRSVRGPLTAARAARLESLP